MIKAKDFLNVMCNDFDYRFFSGMPCVGLAPLYNKMTQTLMHYIPAVNENIALGLVNGVTLSGIKSILLLGSDRIDKLDLSFNYDSSIPVFILTYGCVDFKDDFYIVKFTTNLNKCLKDIERNGLGKNRNSILFFGAGDVL